jgi:hypothetical protein
MSNCLTSIFFLIDPLSSTGDRDAAKRRPKLRQRPEPHFRHHQVEDRAPGERRTLQEEIDNPPPRFLIILSFD